jgi:enamine deaminase RidA (YjgF/YER057c/UK114 family)
VLSSEKQPPKIFAVPNGVWQNWRRQSLCQNCRTFSRAIRRKISIFANFAKRNIMQRQNFAGNSPFESVIGYSRIVKVGPFIYVAGTTATNDEGKIVGVDDAYEQTKQIFKDIRPVAAMIEVKGFISPEMLVEIEADAVLTD